MRDGFSIEVFSGEQPFGTVAVGGVQIGMGGGEWRLLRQRHSGATPVCGPPIPEEGGDPLEEVDESLRPRVHDTVPGENRELFGSVGQGLARAVQAAAEQLAEIVDLAGLFVEGGRPGTQHRQDRSLDGLGESQLRGLGASTNGGDELPCRDGYFRPDRVRHSMEELRQNRPGVAARAVQGSVRRCPGGLPHGKLVGRGQRRCGRAQRGCEVRPRVGVRHRKDVDPVQSLLLPCHRQGPGAERAGEARAGEDLDHQNSPRTSVRRIERPHGVRLLLVLILGRDHLLEFLLGEER